MSRTVNQKEQAETFLGLHHGENIFVLPNAWDVASAMIFINEGYSAIGTTSAGIAASLGYSDGQNMSFRENLEVIERIVSSTSLPVSADFESGYADDANSVAMNALELIDVGVAGLNIEDAPGTSDSMLLDISHQQDKIRAIRETADNAGVRIVINARTDTYLVSDSSGNCLVESVERGNAYVDAGADCVFIPDTGNMLEAEVKTLAAEIQVPINVIAGASMPCLDELQSLGVSRVSLGPRPMRAALGLLREIAREISLKGSFELMSDESISYNDVNSWFTD